MTPSCRLFIELLVVTTQCRHTSLLPSNTSMKMAEESVANADDVPPYCHYTFYFAQMLQIPYPYHTWQVEPLHFKSPLKVQLFGICPH